MKTPLLSLVTFLILHAGPVSAALVPFDDQPIATAYQGVAWLEAADLDGDGDLDVLGAAELDFRVLWWENTMGDGSAWTEHVVGIANEPNTVSAADLDGDGDLDILSASWPEISWWENTAGDGSTWTEHSLVDNLHLAVSSVSAADVDGDGDRDIVGSYLSADIIVWWENASGDGATWLERIVTDSVDGPSSVHPADVDGDGDLDIVAAAGQGDAVAWWENTAGDGSTWSERSIAVSIDGPSSVHAADLDGDGDLDVLATAAFADSVTWWENTMGDGSTWNEETIASGFSSADSVYAADVDVDGDLDVLGAASGSTTTWWENVGGDGSVWNPHLLGNQNVSVHAADLDGDGDVDVLGGAPGIHEVTFWRNQTIHRSATFPEQVTVDDTFGGALSVGTADLDGDGDLDVLGAATDDNDVAWWENTTGDGSGWSEHSIDGMFLGVSTVRPADVDGDGDADVLGASSFHGVVWWENTAGDGSAWSEHAVDADAASTAIPADLDGDGDLDAIGASEFFDDVAWWENTAGDGTAWTEHPVAADFGGAVSVAVGDVDGDGDLDVLGAARTDDELAWWENTAGDGSTWTEHAIDLDFDGARAVRAADVDDDGDVDVVAAAADGNAVAWWENAAGDGTAWTERMIDAAFPGALSVLATDLDGDGDVDVLGGSVAGEGALAWWESTAGDGSAWTKHAVDDAFNAFAVHAADLDGDGDTDLLGAELEDDAVAWWPNRGGQLALPTLDVAPTQVPEGAVVAALEIEAHHRGRTGEQDIELSTLALRLEDGTATALTDAQADDLLAGLTVYLDDGSQVFEPEIDTPVESVTRFALTDGVLTVPFVEDDANVAIPFGSPRTYFVVLTFESSAATATPDEIRVTHLAGSTAGPPGAGASSTGEDAEHGVPVSLENPAETPSAVMEVIGPDIFTDGFESGDTSAWSLTVD